MELRQLRYFEAVSRHLSFTRAAQELHVAQPSISQQIQRLEEGLGVALFHRAKRRVALTEAGRRLLPRVKTILEQVDEAQAELQELTGLRGGTLVVGAPPSVGAHLLPPILAEFGQRYPGIAILFREGGSRTLVQGLVDGEIDLAVVIQPVRHPALETVALMEEELVVVVPPAHPLAGRAGVRLAELRDEPFVLLREGAYELRDQVIAACRRAGFEPRVALDGSEMDSVLGFVGAGIGLTLLPQSVVHRVTAGGPRTVRLDQPRLSRRLVAAWRRDRPLARAAREFLDLLRRRVAADTPERGERGAGGGAGEEPVTHTTRRV